MSITTPMAAEIYGGAGERAHAVVDFTYDEHKPYSVTMLQQGGDAPWEYARELLVQAVVQHRPVGDGDVHIWRQSHMRVCIQVRNNFASAVFRVAYADVINFLNLSLRIVPLDREGEYLHLDDAIARFFQA